MNKSTEARLFFSKKLLQRMGGREGDKVSNRELCRGCGRGESINTIERCGDGVCEIVCVLCKDKCVGDTR